MCRHGELWSIAPPFFIHADPEVWIGEIGNRGPQPDFGVFEDISGFGDYPRSGARLADTHRSSAAPDGAAMSRSVFASAPRIVIRSVGRVPVS